MSENTPEIRHSGTTRWLINLLSITVLALLGRYLYLNREIFVHLRSITALQIVIMIGIEMVNFLLGGYLNHAMIRRLGWRVSYIDNVMLQYANNFLNKILPTIGGGAAFRAVYLKKKYNFPYGQFLSTLGGLYLITFISIGLIGLLCMLVFYLQSGQTNWVILLAYLGLLLPSLGIAIFSPELPQTDHRILRMVRSVATGWNILKRDVREVLLYTLITVLMLFLSAWQMQIAFQSLGVQTGLVPVLFLSSLWIILSFINFTPDGIGIREGVYIFTASLVQIPDTMLVLGSLVLRALSIITTMVIGGVSYWIMFRQIREMEEPKG